MSEIEGRNYQILNTIATGGTAVLYKAIQSSLDRLVVVKRLHSHLTSDPNFTKRFELEAKAAASLDHENIVRIIDFGSSHSNYYIVMEYIDGQSLKELLQKKGTLGEELTLLIAYEICMGLDHAHQRGITHRDIKPANIMITKEGQVKITDFGLAKLHQSQTQQTVANTLLGTPLYMSPEQAIGDSVDGRSDLFSLGTICYEMVTGTQPFVGENYAAVIQNIINGTVPPPSKIRDTVSSEADSMVMKALNREPCKRFRTALEMARAIESHLGQEKILSIKEQLRRLITSDGSSEIVSPTAQKRGSFGRRKVLSAVLTSLAVVGLAVVLGMNPGKLDDLKTRFKALLASNPVPPAEEFQLGSQEELTGPMVVPPLEPNIKNPFEEKRDTHENTTETPKGAVPVDTAQSTPNPFGDSLDTAEPRSANTPGTTSGEIAAEPESATPVIEKEKKPHIGYLEITVEPEAAIYIDGKHHTDGAGLGPLELSVGTHEIVCERETYSIYREAIHIKKGELSRRRIFLERLQGAVHFETDNGIQIFIDDVFKGTTPISRPIKLPVGTHRIELKKLGYKSWVSKVFVPSGETLWLQIKLVPQ